jgi:selT/selW/selH-like putative selenoprotein
MQPRAAGLAAELRERLGAGEVTIEAGELKSEFAVFVDGIRVFSRLEQGRFPEPGELMAAIEQGSKGAGNATP